MKIEDFRPIRSQDSAPIKFDWLLTQESDWIIWTNQKITLIIFWLVKNGKDWNPAIPLVKRIFLVPDHIWPKTIKGQPALTHVIRNYVLLLVVPPLCLWWVTHSDESAQAQNSSRATTTLVSPPPPLYWLWFILLTMFRFVWLIRFGPIDTYASMNYNLIGSDNGTLPAWHQAISWTIVDVLSIGLFGTNFSNIWNETQKSSSTKIHLKMLAAQWQPFCSGLNVLIIFSFELLILVLSPFT